MAKRSSIPFKEIALTADNDIGRPSRTWSDLWPGEGRETVGSHPAGPTTEILIAEDSKAQAEMLADILTSSGYRITAVHDGLEALYAIMESEPRLIISDVEMPRMNGYELCRALKGDNKFNRIPIIILTQLSDLQAMVKGLEAGADYYLTKPYDKDLLLVMVGSILAKTNAVQPNGRKTTMKVSAKGTTFTISVSNQQLLNFLLSTYENLLRHNQTLDEARSALKALNVDLEDKVKEKTSTLEVEIAERKRAHDAHRESEAKYRAVMRDAGDAILLADPNGAILEANRKAETLFSYSKEELETLDLFGLYPPAELVRVKAALKTVMESGGATLNSVQVRRKNGDRVWADITMSTVEYEERIIVQSVVRDITDRIDADTALKESYAKLKQTLDAAILALSKAVEMRDPYTAGHQYRVAGLAHVIGQQLGFDEKRLEGMKVMGFLHDIGKIVVPAEILTKPSKLHEYEFNHIKMHCQAGYDILKEIDFPWPVSSVVLQHHERLDGSGYPFGIGADQIILEARIIAVADVIEAISSHRPYRPALGIEKALDEVVGGRGTLYDADVVDATIAVFRDRKFKLE